MKKLLGLFTLLLFPLVAAETQAADRFNIQGGVYSKSGRGSLIIENAGDLIQITDTHRNIIYDIRLNGSDQDQPFPAEFVDPGKYTHPPAANIRKNLRGMAIKNPIVSNGGNTLKATGVAITAAEAMGLEALIRVEADIEVNSSTCDQSDWVYNYSTRSWGNLKKSSPCLTLRAENPKVVAIQSNALPDFVTTGMGLTLQVVAQLITYVNKRNSNAILQYRSVMVGLLPPSR